MSQSKSSISIKNSLNNGTLHKVKETIKENSNADEQDSSDDLTALTFEQYMQMRKTGTLGPNNEKKYKNLKSKIDKKAQKVVQENVEKARPIKEQVKIKK